MRTRLIVAIAALMAASALVAVPEPAGSRAPSAARSIDPASVTPVSIALPAGTTAMAISDSNDLASGATGRVGPATALVDSADAASTPVKGTVRQPSVKVKTVKKNTWRFDRNISWYGPGFYGSGTACGQRYTRTLMGVAHRTLPCGTMVTFRNPANGRQVTVPVIDRGPYTSGRTWDMSAGLCAYLRHCYTGSIEWRFAGGGG